METCVDLDLLARLYEAEVSDSAIPLPPADSATELAWSLGYLKPERQQP